MNKSGYSLGKQLIQNTDIVVRDDIDETTEKEINRILKNNIGYHGRRYWTDRDIQILVRLYNKAPVIEIQKLLPTFTLQAIKDKANNLGLAARSTHAIHHRWTTKEITILKRLYGKIPTRQIQKRYLRRRTYATICRQARLLGLHT